MDDDAGSVQPTRPTIAVGPEHVEFGSWQWLGADLVGYLSSEFDVRTFAVEEVPSADVVIYIKFLRALGQLWRVRERAVIVYW